MSADTWIVVMLAGVTLLVTLLGVMLAALALAIGIAAVFGYRGMVDEVIKRAEIAAAKVTLDKIEEKAMATAAQVATRVAEKALENIDLGLLLSAAQSETPKTTSNAVGMVGEAYPGEEANPHDNDDDDAGADNLAPPADAPG